MRSVSVTPLAPPVRAGEQIRQVCGENLWRMS